MIMTNTKFLLIFFSFSFAMLLFSLLNDARGHGLLIFSVPIFLFYITRHFFFQNVTKRKIFISLLAESSFSLFNVILLEFARFRGDSPLQLSFNSLYGISFILICLYLKEKFKFRYFIFFMLYHVFSLPLTYFLISRFFSVYRNFELLPNILYLYAIQLLLIPTGWFIYGGLFTIVMIYIFYFFRDRKISLVISYFCFTVLLFFIRQEQLVSRAISLLVRYATIDLDLRAMQHIFSLLTVAVIADWANTFIEPDLSLFRDNLLWLNMIAVIPIYFMYDYLRKT